MKAKRQQQNIKVLHEKVFVWGRLLNNKNFLSQKDIENTSEQKVNVKLSSWDPKPVNPT